MKAIDYSYFIERYIAGEMDQKEKEWFEKEIEGNDALKNEIILRRKTDQVLARQDLMDLRKKLKAIQVAREEQKKSGLSKEEFSIFMILKDENLQNPQKLAKNIMDVLEDYPHWCSYSEHEREAKQKINKVLINNNLSAGKSVSATGKILMILKRAKSEG